LPVSTMAAGAAKPPKFLVEERVQRFEKSVRKKRRRLPKNDYTNFETRRMQSAEQTILNLPKGFNSDPFTFMTNVVLIKYKSAIKTFKAIDRFHVYRDTRSQLSQDKKAAARVYKCLERDDADSLIVWLNQGFDVNFHNRHGETVLHFACKNNAVGCVHELIQRKAKVGVSCTLGKTPLHMALAFHKEISMELVRLLCNYEPTMLLATDEHNDTPLDIVNPVQWPAICDFINLYVDHYHSSLRHSFTVPTLGNNTGFRSSHMMPARRAWISYQT